MNTQRFEAWWSGSPQRAGLSTVAKEIARGIWRAAQEDLAAEVEDAVAQAPNPSFKEMRDALWISQLGLPRKPDGGKENPC